MRRRQHMVLRPVSEEVEEDLLERSLRGAPGGEEAVRGAQARSPPPAEVAEQEGESAGLEADFRNVEAVLHDRALFLEFCVVEGHSDMQQDERRSTMDSREFLTLLRSLGIMADSPTPPTHEALLRTSHRLSKTNAACAFRDACTTEEAIKQKQMNGMNRTLLKISELTFEMYCEAASACAAHLTKGHQNHTSATLSKVADSLSKVVESTSGLRMERIEQARRSRKAKMRALETSPLKQAMPKQLEPYREERRKLLFSNLPAGFHNPDAPQAQSGAHGESVALDEVVSEDPVLDRVGHFLLDKNLFLQYCMIPGHSAVQSGARQKSMDMKEFLYMTHQVGALKSGELGRGDIKGMGTAAEFGEGKIPAIEGLERKQLTKRQATNCFRAAMAQATSQSLLAAGELNFDLYRIAAKLVAKVYVHGEPEQQEKGGKTGRTSCPPVLTAMPLANSNTEIYKKIVDALPRLRPCGENKLLDGVEDLLLDPEVFERFCVIEGHSSLQAGSRRSTMDQYEWLRCLADLGLMPAEELKENRVLDPFLKKKEKKVPPQYPAVVEKLERRISKEDAVDVFRRALGKSSAKHGAPAGELNFRRYCVAVQIAASILVLGEDSSKTAHGPSLKPRRNVKRAGAKRVMMTDLPEWNDRFTVPSRRADSIVRMKEVPASKVSFQISSDVTRPSVERALSEKCVELANNGDRAMLREEFCSRFSRSDTFSMRDRQLYQKENGSSAAVSEENEERQIQDAALSSSIISSLESARLVPEFYSKAYILQLLAEVPADSPSASAMKPKTPKSVTFGAPSSDASEIPIDGHRPNHRIDGMQAAAARRAQFREGLDRIASKMELGPLDSFLQSVHAWYTVPTSLELDEDGPRKGRQKSMQKRQIPPTPWTQAHPTAAHRPRTSVRVLMLNQKELRKQHVRQQEGRRMFEMKRLEGLKKDLELREKAEQLRLSKKMRWRQAMDQVDRKIADMKREEEMMLQSTERHKMTLEQALDTYAEATYLGGKGHVPAYTQLPVTKKTHSLSSRLGFVSLEIARTKS